MSVRRHECIVITCDVCGHPFRDEYGEQQDVHFANLEQARYELRRVGWLMTDDGRALCPVETPAHQAARDALGSGAQR